MRLAGTAIRIPGEKSYRISVPAVDVVAHAANAKEVADVAIQTVGALLERHTDGVVGAKDLRAHRGRGSSFTIETTETPAVLSMILRRLRARQGLSLQEVATLTGQKSKHGVSQYENFRAAPSVAKLQEILGALELDVLLTIVDRKSGLPIKAEFSKADADIGNA